LFCRIVKQLRIRIPYDGKGGIEHVVVLLVGFWLVVHVGVEQADHVVRRDDRDFPLQCFGAGRGRVERAEVLRSTGRAGRRDRGTA
jgi:hypothetical protein